MWLRHILDLQRFIFVMRDRGRHMPINEESLVIEDRRKIEMGVCGVRAIERYVREASGSEDVSNLSNNAAVSSRRPRIVRETRIVPLHVPRPK